MVSAQNDTSQMGLGLNGGGSGGSMHFNSFNPIDEARELTMEGEREKNDSSKWSWVRGHALGTNIFDRDVVSVLH